MTDIKLADLINILSQNVDGQGFGVQARATTGKTRSFGHKLFQLFADNLGGGGKVAGFEDPSFPFGKLTPINLIF